MSSDGVSEMISGRVSHITTDPYRPGYIIYSIADIIYTTDFTITEKVITLSSTPQPRLSFDVMSREALLVLDHTQGRLMRINRISGTNTELHPKGITAFALDMSTDPYEVILSLKEVISWARFSEDEIHFVGDPLHILNTNLMHFDSARERLYVSDEQSVLQSMNSTRGQIETNDPMKLTGQVVAMSSYNTDYLLLLVRTGSDYNLVFLHMETRKNFTISLSDSTMSQNKSELTSLTFNESRLYVGSDNGISCFIFNFDQEHLDNKGCWDSQDNQLKAQAIQG